MARPAARVRSHRANGPRKGRAFMRLRPVAVFVLLNLLAAGLGTVLVLMPGWRQDAVAEKHGQGPLQPESVWRSRP